MSLFALPFFGVGVWMLWSVGSTFHDAWQMRAWSPVEAELVAAGYETHSGDDSDTYEAYASFRFTWLGQVYRGDRVSISSGGDNIGDYQTDLGNDLRRRQARGQTVTVYVDPDDPSQSIIDRNLRWGLLGFRSIFLFVFGGVGLGLLIFTWRAPKEKDRSLPEFRDAPWLLNDDWQTPAIRSGSRVAMWGAWVFAALWNLISAPTPFLAWREFTKNDNYLVLIALLFPLVGIGLLTWAIRRTMEWRRFGRAPVTMDPFPGAIGGHVGGTIDLNLPYDSATRFELTLTNVHSYVSGSGDDRSQREKAAWQDSLVAHAEPGGRGTRLTFRFDVPEDLRASDAEQLGDSYYLWRLNLKAELPGADLDRDYNIPVYPTGERSRRLSEHAVQSARSRRDAAATDRVRDVIRIDYGSSGAELFYPAGRHVGASFFGVIFGGIFAAGGWFLIVNEEMTIFGSVFGGVGALVCLLALYVMSNSLQVRQDSLSISTVRRWFGIPIRRKRLLRQQFARFSKDSHFQTQSGGKHVIYYTIYAHDRLGNKLVVGEGFNGESEANAAIAIIGRELGLQEKQNEAAGESGEGLYGADVLTADR